MTDLAPLPRRALWTLSAAPGAVLGERLPLLPCATADLGRAVRSVAGPAWGWTAPDAFGAASPALVADVELRSWRGGRASAREAEVAERLAATCPGITSHGYAPSRLAHALEPFALLDRVGFPQVYDSDRSIDPATFIRRCVDTWRRRGFDRVVPLLGLQAGPKHVRTWIEWCEREGLVWHLWSLGEWRKDARGWSKLVGEYLAEEKSTRTA